jgi:hypothetical protein
MKGLLVVLVLLLIGIASLGVYRVWFNLSSDNTDHKSNVTFTVDQDKFKEDEEMAKEKAQDFRVGPDTESGDFDVLSGTDKRKNN